MMTKFYGTDSETRWWIGIYGRLILAVILLSLIGGGFYIFHVLTAAPKGRADVYRQQQSGNNRIFQQQHFEDLFADYTATVAKIPVYEKAASTGDSTATTNLLGLRSHCSDVAAQYNADSQKVLASDFKTADLPVSLDISKCQES